MFAAGVIDYPRQRSVIDPFAGFETARKIEEGGIVLLKNEHAVLPLNAAKLHTIAVIGSHSDVGMISGGGSAQVDPIGGNAIMPPGKGATHWHGRDLVPHFAAESDPGARTAKRHVKYDPGTDPAAAAAAAKGADVAIVFAYSGRAKAWICQSLTLPHQQDDVIAAVAAANPHTIVVLETGNPVTMPWVDAPAAILEAWFAGSDGANAVGNVFFGSVNPSGKLPNTFPKSEADLPHPTLTMPPPESAHFSGAVSREERGPRACRLSRSLTTKASRLATNGTRLRRSPCCFPLASGSPTRPIATRACKVTPGDTVKVTFTSPTPARARGRRSLKSTPRCRMRQASLSSGWSACSKVKLDAKEKQTVTVDIDPKYLSIFDEAKDGWTLLPGDYTILVGGSSAGSAAEGDCESEVVPHAPRSPNRA